MQFTAIILAAGTGTRLRPHTDDRPKALVPLHGVSLLHRAVSFLRLLAPERIVVVSGSGAAAVSESLRAFAPDVDVFENSDYTLGSVVSLKRALEQVPGAFIQCNTDHVYGRRLAPVLLAQADAGITAFCDTDRPLGGDDMKVWQEEGRLVRLSKTLESYKAGFTGIIMCDAERRSLFDAAHEAVLQQDRRLGVEHILAVLAEPGRQVRIGDMSGHRWLEVDTPQDLELAEQAITAEPDAFNFDGMTEPDG
ncbi:MAG: NTP transferase domain-containing protein [Patescibacteria group bacterium]